MHLCTHTILPCTVTPHHALHYLSTPSSQCTHGCRFHLEAQLQRVDVGLDSQLRGGAGQPGFRGMEERMAAFRAEVEAQSKLDVARQVGEAGDPFARRARAGGSGEEAQKGGIASSSGYL